MGTFCVDPEETLPCCRNLYLDDSVLKIIIVITQPSATVIDEVLDGDENLNLDVALQSEFFCQPDEEVMVKIEDTLLC